MFVSRNHLLAFVLVLCYSQALLSKTIRPVYDFRQMALPMVGTSAHGHTFPGATLPFALVQLSPDTRIDGSWDGCSGYHYSDSIIYGFSHTHLSGTGCSDYGDISFLPTFSAYPLRTYVPSGNAPITFHHASEKAEPGYYAVKLSNGIQVELTSTNRVGFQKYTYDKDGFTWISLDLEHRDELIEGKINQIDAQTFSGLRRSKAWAQDQWVYYYFQINREAEKVEIQQNAKGEYSLHLGYTVKKGESILIKTALSSVNEQGAKNNLQTELSDWNFNKTKEKAAAQWQAALGVIQVYGGTLAEQQNFYTALYHCMMHPNVMNDVDGRYRGRDNKVYKDSLNNHYTVFSLWDTYRALHPLLNIIDKQRSHDFMMTFKAQFEQSGRLPMWELWGNETNCMIGFHSVSVIWNAYLKNVISIAELSALYPAVYAEAMSNRTGLDLLRQKGYLSVEDESESVSKTLEYSFNMYCVSKIAEVLSYAEIEGCQTALKLKDDAEQFMSYANAWRNLRDAQTGFMTPRANGNWLEQFDPKQVNNHYTEANAWQYTFAVQHQAKAIQNDTLLSRLFNTASKTSGREQADITGLIGQYAHGNEPSHHFAYLFTDMDSTAKYVKRILETMYSPSPDGLSGNEDCGQMSAWYVFSAMGLYPANPASTELVFGHMLFDSVRLNLENGPCILYKQAPPQTALKSGQYRKARSISHLSSHSVIYHGYDLEQPKAIQFCVPDSVSPEFSLSAPVIIGAKEVFKDSINVQLLSNNIASELGNYKTIISYTTDGSEPQLSSYKYLTAKSISIQRTTTLKAREFVVDQTGAVLAKSPIASAHLFQYDHDYSVSTKGQYNPQYSGGGNNAVVDGLKGDKDWRKGRWQGFQGQNVEFIVDLKSNPKFDTISIGLLKDVRAWICLPMVELDGSNDGINFTNLTAGDFTYPLTDLEVERVVMPFTSNSKNYRYRYYKIKLWNAGKLPAWHPGANGESFIFIDEIEFK